MANLKEVAQVVVSVSIGVNRELQLLNIMVSGHGLSAKEVETRRFNVDAKKSLSKKDIVAFEKLLKSAIVKAVKP